MKIIISSASYIFSDHIPGGEYQIAHAIISRLARRGHQLHVFAPIVQLSQNIPNTTVYELGRYNFSQTRSYTDYHAHWWRFSVLAYRKARELLKRHRIDLIHHIRPAYPRKFSLCCSLDIPFIYGPMSLPWASEASQGGVSRWIRNGLSPITDRLIDRLNMAIGHRLWERTLAKADAIPVSVPSARRVVLPAECQKKSPLIPLGVDARMFVPATSGPHAPRLLFTGRLEKLKGLDYLFRALPRVLVQFPELELTVVGKGRDEVSLRILAEELGVSRHIQFVGEVPFQDMPPFFQKADIFCLPSLGEPFGLVVLQAMSCGLPIVATRAGGIPEFAEDGHAALLVPIRDPDALAEAILKLLQDPSLRIEMGRTNRILCENRFDWEVVVDQIEALYQEAVQKQE